MQSPIAVDGDRDRLSLRLADAMVQFQFIEEAIRIYLKAVYSLVNEEMEGKVDTRLSVNKLKGKGLKFLLEEFRKFGGGEELISDILALGAKRNDIAHEAFFRMSRLKIDDDRTQHIKDLDAVISKAHGCLKGLLEAAERVVDMANVQLRRKGMVLAIADRSKSKKALGKNLK